MDSRCCYYAQPWRWRTLTRCQETIALKRDFASSSPKYGAAWQGPKIIQGTVLWALAFAWPWPNCCWPLSFGMVNLVQSNLYIQCIWPWLLPWEIYTMLYGRSMFYGVMAVSTRFQFYQSIYSYLTVMEVAGNKINCFGFLLLKPELQWGCLVIFQCFLLHQI